MPSIQDYLDSCKALDKSNSPAISPQQNSTNYDVLCTFCGSIVENNQFTVCTWCMNNGKDAGWFDEQW